MSSGYISTLARSDRIEVLLDDDAGIPGKRVLEILEGLGYRGSKTILYDYLREIRSHFLEARTFQRTRYRPGELVQFDLWEPSGEIPVGCGQTRPRFVVVGLAPSSRAGAGALVFSRQAPDLLFDMARCLGALGGLPERLVWDREGALCAGDGRPTDAYAGFCGPLPVGWVFCRPRDPEAKGRWSACSSAWSRASSPAAASPTRPTSRPSSTAGFESAPTPACTA